MNFLGFHVWATLIYLAIITKQNKKPIISRVSIRFCTQGVHNGEDEETSGKRHLSAPPTRQPTPDMLNGNSNHSTGSLPERRRKVARRRPVRLVYDLSVYSPVLSSRLRSAYFSGPLG